MANDPVYSNTSAFGRHDTARFSLGTHHSSGPKLGRGGIDLTPSSERIAPIPPPKLSKQAVVATNAADMATKNEYLGRTNVMPPNTFHQEAVAVLNGEPERVLLPRETGEDIGYASPVPLSVEAVKVIMALRNMKDGDENWGRWRQVLGISVGRC